MIMNSPEPMSLGSPTQSPTMQNSGQYLPQFLLGDLVPNQNPNLRSGSNQMSSKYWSGANLGSSPPRNSPSYQNIPGSAGIQRNYSIGGYDAKLNNSNYAEKAESSFFNQPHIHSTQNHHYHYSPHQDRSINSTTILTGSQTMNVPPSGPPVNRLIDMVNKPTFGSQQAPNLLTPTDRMKPNIDYHGEKYGPDLPFTPSSNVHRQMSPPSPTQIDPFYTHGESIQLGEKFDETWITVFGFPSSATSYVLQEFSVYGQIIKHVLSNQGNWLHIQYQTKLQAQKALSKNGKILANSLMIGVMQCIDKSVMSSSVAPAQTILEEPISPSKAIGPSALKKQLLSNAGTKLDRTQSLRTNVRPLGPFNRNIENLHSQAGMDSSKLPKKNTNVISKAMEFMFGW